MELNREQIEKAIKTLEGAKVMVANRDFKEFQMAVITAINALSLIRELTEENESLRQCMEHEHASFMETFGEYGEKCERLAEENERLKAENAEQDEAIIKALQRMGEVRRETQADTVRKMQERLKSTIADLEYRANVKRKTVSVETLLEQVNWILHEIVPTEIDQIAKELLEGTK